MAGVKPVMEIVSVNSTSQTLASLVSGSDLLDSTFTVTLRPHAAGIFMNNGTASAASDPLGTTSIEIQGTALDLSELEFFAAVATKMTVIQEGTL